MTRGLEEFREARGARLPGRDLRAALAAHADHGDGLEKVWARGENSGWECLKCGHRIIESNSGVVGEGQTGFEELWETSN